MNRLIHSEIRKLTTTRWFKITMAVSVAMGNSATAAKATVSLVCRRTAMITVLRARARKASQRESQWASAQAARPVPSTARSRSSGAA